uniref:Ribosomal protein S3 n=1 Tax=Jakoba bahamiensis TaxID=221721 RepID=M4Q9W2_9EUKA|nr:ribosomal protein S3 [Jakoba bahamiensis]AGH24156.1 ribosomal protein S3 [Jakoba bahamiensis]
MGQKVNPISLRISDRSSESWLSSWHSADNFKKFLHEDIKIRSFLKGFASYQKLYLSDVYIWRPTRSLEFTPLSVAEVQPSVELKKPSLHIYFQLFFPLKKHNYMSSWEEKNAYFRKIEYDLRMYLNDLFDDSYSIFLVIDPILENESIRVQSISGTNDESGFDKNDDLLSNYLREDQKDIEFLIRWLLQKDSTFIAQWFADEIQKRRGIRDLLKKIDKAYLFLKEMEQIESFVRNSRYFIKGIKVSVSGRFLMTDNEKRRNKMARIKHHKQGRISLHTLKENISYSHDVAYTVDGTSGVKVWICYDIRC